MTDVTVPADSTENASVPSTPLGQMFRHDPNYIVTATPHSMRTDAGDAASDKIRDIVAQNMNSETFLCRLDDFLAEYGPQKVDDFDISESDITKCKAYLRTQSHVVRPRTGDEYWKAFPTSPSKMPKNENGCFAGLKPIVDDIFKWAKANTNRRNKFEFALVPDSNIDAAIPGTNHKMDACVVEEPWSGDGKLPNNIVIIPIEGKKYDTKKDWRDVRSQVVGDCHHILSDDVRRMFVYGITILNDRMTLWYFSRSHSVKALSFEWLTAEGIDMFIKIMLLFALASPEALGLDPTVHKVKPFDGENREQYVYEVEVPLAANSAADTSSTSITRALRSTSVRNAREEEAAKRNMKKLYFRTVEHLSAERPLCISGRITRVYIVRQIENLDAKTYLQGSDPVILKDVWIGSQDRTETENIKLIFAAVDKFVQDAQAKHPGPDGLKTFMDTNPRFKHFNQVTKDRLRALLTGKLYQSLFLTTVHTWSGKETKPLSKNVHEPTEVIFQEDPLFPRVNANTSEKPSLNPVHTTLGTAKNPLPNAPVTPNRDLRLYGQKTQRRFIFKEICTPLYNIPTFGDAMKVIRQAFDAIQILYCAGWVHRDISPGNILAIGFTDANGSTQYKVKLADFEFAQTAFYPKHKSDPRTGTPYFMPVEIMRRKYLHEMLRLGSDNYWPPADDDEDDDEDSEDEDWENEVDAETATIIEEDTEPNGPRGLVTRLGIEPGDPAFEYLKHFGEFMPITKIPADAVLEKIPGEDAVVNYNYQHDLESIFWIILYFATVLCGNDKAKTYASSEFFIQDLNSPHRQFFLTHPFPREFKKTVRPELRKIVRKILEPLRKALHEQYVKRALFGQVDDHHAYSFIHHAFSVHLTSLLNPPKRTSQLPVAKSRVRGIQMGTLAPQFQYSLKRTADDGSLEAADDKKPRLEVVADCDEENL